MIHACSSITQNTSKYRVFRFNFQAQQHFPLLARCFSTAVKCCICITNIFQCLHMIFNTSQAGQSLRVLCDVLKIMLKNWNFIVMQIYRVFQVKSIGGLNKDRIKHWLERSHAFKIIHVWRSSVHTQTQTHTHTHIRIKERICKSLLLQPSEAVQRTWPLSGIIACVCVGVFLLVCVLHPYVLFYLSAVFSLLWSHRRGRKSELKLRLACGFAYGPSNRISDRVAG